MREDDEAFNQAYALTSAADTPLMIAGGRSANKEWAHQVECYQFNGGTFSGVFRCKDGGLALKMVQVMIDICNNPNIGYSMSSLRDTLVEEMRKVNWNAKLVKNKCYTDCSASCATCINAVGIKCPIFSTSSEVNDLLSTGMFFKVCDTVTPSSHKGIKLGDLFWRQGHAAMVVGIGNFNGEQLTGSYSGGALSESQYSSNTQVIKGSIPKEVSVTNTAVENYDYEYVFDTKTVTYTVQQFVTADSTSIPSGTGLLTYPTLVEAPFIQFQVADYVFGTYQKNGNSWRAPNYITGMQITKINGAVNKYTIQLEHRIEAGADPNLLDKIFSKAKYGATVYITYGDYNVPSVAYKKEKAILLKVTNNVNFQQSLIQYTVSCTSDAALLSANLFDFTDSKYVGMHKPSDIIRDMIWGSGRQKYKLDQVFTGMSNQTTCNKLNLLASDDAVVELYPQIGMNPINYINYLVSCMCSVTSSPNSPLKDSTYKMSIYDETENDKGIQGTYFKIQKVSSSHGSKTYVDTSNIYTVDVGYPSDNQVMSFEVKNDQSWALLYDYSGSTKEFIYNINDSGKLSTEYVPKLAVSRSKNAMTEQQKTWWTNMTQFPIKATLKIKGLIRPAMLMQYVRINALFYGQRHITSGLYFITAQKDSLDGSGYRTTLELQRIAGPDDYIQTVEKQKEITLPIKIVATAQYSEKTVTADFSTSTITEIDTGVDYGYETYDGLDASAMQNNWVVSTGTLPGGSVSTSQVWQLLLSFIGNEYGVAGAMGNLWYESAGSSDGTINFSILEYDAKSKYKKNCGIDYSQEAYTKAVDEGIRLNYIGSEIDNENLTPGRISKFEFCHMPWKTYSDAARSSGTYPWGCNGYGMCQWTTAARKAGLWDLARKKKMSIGSSVIQIEYLMQELKQGYTGVFSGLKSAKDVVSATDLFYRKFEGPWNDSSLNSRINMAQKYYNTFAKGKNYSIGVD